MIRTYSYLGHYANHYIVNMTMHKSIHIVSNMIYCVLQIILLVFLYSKRMKNVVQSQIKTEIFKTSIGTADTDFKSVTSTNLPAGITPSRNILPEFGKVSVHGCKFSAKRYASSQLSSSFAKKAKRPKSLKSVHIFLNKEEIMTAKEAKISSSSSTCVKKPFMLNSITSFQKPSIKTKNKFNVKIPSGKLQQ